MATLLEVPKASNALLDAIPAEMVQRVCSQRGLKDRHGTKLTLDLTVDLLVAAATRPNLGMQSVLEELVDVRGAPRNWEKDYLPHSSQIAAARDRLGWEAMRDVYRLHAEWVNAGASRLRWKGFRLGAIDGTTLRAEDTAENSAVFKRPTGRNGPGGFPALRLLALADVQSHHVQAATFGPYAGKGTGEVSLLQGFLLQQVPRDWLSLLDRGFCSYGTMRDFVRADRKFLIRMKRSGHWVRLRKTQTLSAGQDWMVECPVPASFTPRAGAEPLKLRLLKWSAPKQRSKRKTKKKKARAKKTTPSASKAAPKRSRHLWLLTNLVDAEKYPYQELAPIYLRRWEVEFVFREIKTTLTGRKVEFRTKTPTRVLQEAYALLLAYNAIRLRMAQAAKTAKVEPCRLSFKRSLEAVRQAYVDGSPLRRLRRRVARYVLEERETRHYPRAVKARSTRFPTKPNARAA